MASFTTNRAGRDTDNLLLTATEAAEMLSAGFRFSVFGESGQYRLSLPFTTRWNVDRDTITFVQ